MVNLFKFIVLYGYKNYRYEYNVLIKKFWFVYVIYMLYLCLGAIGECDFVRVCDMNAYGLIRKPYKWFIIVCEIVKWDCVWCFIIRKKYAWECV